MAKKLETALIISGDASGGLRVIKATQTELDKMAQSSKDAGKAATLASKVQQDSFAQTIPVVRSTTDTIKEYTKAVAGAFAVKEVISVADEWNQISARIKQAAGSTDEFAVAQSRLLDIAKKNHTAFEGVADLYTGSAGLLKAEGFNNDQTLKFVNTISSGIKMVSADAETAQSIFMAFDHALALGSFQMEDFNTLNLKARPLLMELADAMGITESQLVKLASSGKLSTDQWLPALMKASGQIEKAASAMPNTVAGSLQVLKDQFMAYVGQVNQANGATTTLASGIDLVSDHLNVFMGIIASAGAAKLSQMLVSSAIAAKKSAVAALENAAAAKEASIAAKADAVAEQQRAAAHADQLATTVQMTSADLQRARAAETTAASNLAAAQAEQQRAALTAALAAGTRNQAAAELALSAANEKVAISQTALTAAQKATQVATAASTAAIGAQTAVTNTATVRNSLYQTSLLALSGTLNVVKNGLRALTLAFGGWPGIALTVASVAATFLLFRQHTDETNSSITDLNTTVDEAIRKFQSLTQAQKDAVQLDLATKLQDQSDAMGDSLDTIAAKLSTWAIPRSVTGSYDDFNAVLEKVRNGEADASELSKAAQKDFMIPEWVKNSVIQLASEYDTAKGKIDEYRQRQDALTATQDTSTNSLHNNTAATNTNSDAWLKFIGNMESARDILGMTAQQEAEYNAQKQGFTAQQIGYAGAIAGETDELKKYQKAIESGKKTEAEAHLQRARESAEQAALWQAQGIAVVEMGKNFQKAQLMVSGLSGSLSTAAIQFALSFDSINAQTGDLTKNAIAQVNARAKALLATANIGGGNGKGTTGSGNDPAKKLADDYAQQSKQLRETIALQGQATEVAKIRYATEQGDLKKLSAAQKKALLDLAAQADQSSIAKQAADRIKGMDEQIAMFGKEGEAAKIAYDLERGELAKLTGAQRETLQLRAKEIDLLERRKDLMSNYLPDASSLSGFAKDQADINSMLSGTQQEYAQKAFKDRIKDYATEGMPDQSSLDASVGGPFSEIARMQRENDEYEKAYQKRLDLLQAYAEKRLTVEGDTDAQSNARAAIAKDALSALEDDHRKRTAVAEQQMNAARMAGYASTFGGMADTAKTFFGEQSGLYKGAFAASKAFSVAQAAILVPSVFMEVYRSIASIPFVGPFIAPVMASAAAASMIAQQSSISSTNLTGMAHNGISSVPKEGTWLLDEDERVLNGPQNSDLTNFLARENRASTQRNEQASKAAQPAAAASPPVINIVEDASRAGQTSTSIDDLGRQVTEVVVSNIRSEQEIWQAMATKGGLSARGN